MRQRRPFPRLPRAVAAVAITIGLLAGCTTTVPGTGRLESARTSGHTATAPTATAPPGTTTAPVPPPTAPGSTDPGSAAPPAPTMPTQAPIPFADCTDQVTSIGVPIQGALRGKLRFGCATLSVPLDYSRPSGAHINLQLLRIHDVQGGDKIGSLLVNPGGPGGSGLELALGLLGRISPSILEHFDLIGFDPRGVGQSTPIDCIGNSLKDELDAESPNILTAAGFATAKALAARVARGCSARYGPALAQYNTVNTARDMDLIRQAVGDGQLNYLGFSYGTELGAAYIHLFPSTVRVAVLDGAVDPLTSGIQQFADQLGGFEQAFDQFSDWCVKRKPCDQLDDPRRTVHLIVTAARGHPLSPGAAGGSREVTGSLVLTGVLEALYSKSMWGQLGRALIQGARGDGAGLLSLADEYNQRYNGQYSNLMDANLTISCNDQAPGPSDAKIRATARKWATEFPMFGRWAAISLFGCQDWQPIRTVPPLPTAPTTPHRILVVGNLHDPATPYQGAIDLTTTLGNAELLSWDGEGHTSYLQGSGCVDRYVNDYLISGALPPRDTTCPS